MEIARPRSTVSGGRSPCRAGQVSDSLFIKFEVSGYLHVYLYRSVRNFSCSCIIKLIRPTLAWELMEYAGDLSGLNNIPKCFSISTPSLWSSLNIGVWVRKLRYRTPAPSAMHNSSTRTCRDGCECSEEQCQCDDTLMLRHLRLLLIICSYVQARYGPVPD